MGQNKDNIDKNDNQDRIFHMLSQLCSVTETPLVHTPKSRLHVNWKNFCHSLRIETTLMSNWARFADKIVMLSQQAKITLSEHYLKFGFRVSLALTLRALRIKGVSPIIVARTKQLLCNASVDTQI